MIENWLPRLLLHYITLREINNTGAPVLSSILMVEIYLTTLCTVWCFSPAVSNLRSGESQENLRCPNMIYD